MVKVLNIIWWIYNNSPYNINQEITSYLKFYQDSLCRKIYPKSKIEVDVDLDKVENAIQTGIKWLENIQRKDGCIGGRLWEVWDTANAVLALSSTGIESEATESAVNFLLRSQLNNGGFFYENYPASREDIMYRRDLYCIETTPVALMGIYKFKNEITPEIKNGLDFLYEKQTDCGGWELPYMVRDRSDAYFPSITGYALRAIFLIEKNSSKIKLEKALNFIEKTQYKNGCWGRSRNYYNTEGYPIRNMVSSLASIKKLKDTKEINLKTEKILNSAISYIKRSQNIDGSWSSMSIASKAMNTSLYLQALLTADSNDRIAINSAVEWLLKHQEEKGLWKGGYYYGHCGYLVYNDVFTTSEALVALSEFKKVHKIT